MPGEPSVATIRLYLKPAVRKFVAAKLGDLHRAAGDQTAMAIWRILEERMGVKLLAVHGQMEAADLPKAYILVDVLADETRLAYLSNPDRERSWHREALNAKVNEKFYQDMYNWVDWYRFRLNWTTVRSLEQFRKHYSISEEDYPFNSCWRMYMFHAKSKGLVRPYVRA